MRSRYPEAEDTSALKEIYELKGSYCEEYAEEYKRIHSPLKGDDYFTLAEIYIEMEDYEKAKDLLSHITPASMFDDINQGQFEHLWITILLYTQRWEDALERYKKNRSFLDVFMSNPVRASIAGDYNENAAILSAIDEEKEDVETYLSRLREWCDMFPKNRMQVSITEAEVLFATGKEEKAEDALHTIEQDILLNNKYKYEWERENMLKKLYRARRLKRGESPRTFH